MITFSTDTKKQTLEDYEMSRNTAIRTFGISSDPKQWKPTEEDSIFIMSSIPECMNFIKNNNEFIGFTLIIPSTKQLMTKFINKEINENDLWLAVKNKEVTCDNFNAIYLCASIIDENYRNRGLATNGFVKSIEELFKNIKAKPLLFFWGFSDEGRALASKVSKELNLKLIERKD